MLDTLRRRYPAILALLVQVLALLITWIVLQVGLVTLHYRAPLIGAACLQGVLAAALGQWMGLHRWWLFINLAFVPALVAFAGYAIPGWVFLAGFFVILLLNWNSLTERVPLYLTGHETQRKLSELIAERSDKVSFIDLGSGLAGTLVYLSRLHPKSHFTGVETAPMSFLLSWLRCLPRRNCRIRYQSLWKVDLAEYDVVYCFLSPAPMPDLWKKAQAEMRPGALFISNTFEIPGVPPRQVIELNDWRQSKILIWQR
ncbi:class I SAM-dependent methyltransferase [Pseudomonas luteola]|uniref:class I SAM-dependent methyltransferase n=1 Tax=Pseudomonas luteola TaxID=47886 RepID=UPI000F771C37|nr:class I SAM-dependent methyltransferase [Pseudomonas luteola]RRW48037.1 class I SAM-dependent methyltransferase [Pseudomonas luteola]